MATRGWSKVLTADQPRSRSKYGNVKTEIDGVTFDSKREAKYWQGLKAREHNGEITELRRQVVFPLCCPVEDRAVMVASYIADFCYLEDGRQHVVDAKGHKTRIYLLKKKWLRLQDGITVEEV